MTLPFHGIFSAVRREESERSAISTGPLDDPSDSTPHVSSSHAGKLAVDIFEQDEYYIVRAPIAGVRLSDLDIEINENTVAIRGKRTPPDTVSPDQFYLQECYWGPFSRKVTLPCQIDPKRVRATFNRDCILKIIIPKEEKVKIVRITEG